MLKACKTLPARPQNRKFPTTMKLNMAFLSVFKDWMRLKSLASRTSTLFSFPSTKMSPFWCNTEKAYLLGILNLLTPEIKLPLALRFLMSLAICNYLYSADSLFSSSLTLSLDLGCTKTFRLLSSEASLIFNSSIRLNLPPPPASVPLSLWIPSRWVKKLS